MNARASVLVASPDYHLLRSTERCIASLGHTAHSARTLSGALRTFTRTGVDAVCLDTLFPHDALERFWATVCTAGRSTASLLFFAPPAAAYVDAALPAFFRRDRDGLVTKPVEADALAQALTRVLSERPRRASRPLQLGSMVLDRTSHVLLFADGGSVPLTRTEYRLLEILVSRPGEFVCADELLEEAWGYPKGTGGPEIVRAHVSNLRRKLRSAGKDPQLIRTMPYQGYAVVAEGVKEAAGRHS